MSRRRARLTRHLTGLAFPVMAASLLASCAAGPAYDVVIRNGLLYDGSGLRPVKGDLAIRHDTIASVGPDAKGEGRLEIDASGCAVSPGFINMLSWANESLLEDGRSQSDIRQGITLEVMGEGWSMGPWNEQMKQHVRDRQGDIKYEITWTTLGEYLETLERRGISPNVASFVGATTVRIHELGEANRSPKADELERMETLVRDAMAEGALGVASALIYAPAFSATTEELVALCRVASACGGTYISHIRSEGDRLLEAADECVRIAREADIPAEIYHMKAAGASNWHKLDSLVALIERARAEGLQITADMYTYTAAATGLDAALPPWVQEGGLEECIRRLADPGTRRRVLEEMSTPSGAWENFFLAAGSAQNILLAAFKQDSLKHLTGRTLARVASERGRIPEETILDLITHDRSRVGAVYFVMSEENVRREIQLPWVSFGSDEESVAPEGVFLLSNHHPRAYGNVARLLGRYVRDERLITLEEAVRRLTSLPAENLHLDHRGRLRPGYAADVVVFDPELVEDHATYDQPHRYATGVRHVLVNGIRVLADGEHTGAMPGKVVRGRGWNGTRSLAE